MTNTASTGPRTESGKTASSQNRLSHGLCAKKFRVLPEERPEFERFYNDMLPELAPVGAMEAQLAEAVIFDLWRMQRARNIENEIFAQGLFKTKDKYFAGAETWTARGADLALLQLYSQRIHRVLTRNQADLAALQEARKAAQSSAPANVEAPAQPADPEPEPAAVEFVRSAPSAAQPAAAQEPLSPAPIPDSGPPNTASEAAIAA